MTAGHSPASWLAGARRRREAAAAIDAALARDPNNAVTHANRGWALLHQGKPQEALTFFREALRLDADFELARQGVIEALKARFVVYRLLLRLFRSMAQLNRKVQWLLVAVGGLGSLGVLAAAEVSPSLAPVLWPVLGAYLAFGMLVWVADPLFNLLLRLDRFGRLALSREQLAASNAVGVCLLGAAACFLAWLGLVGFFPAERTAPVLAGSGLCVLLTLPTAGACDCPPGRPRRAMAAYTAAVAAAGFGGLAWMAVDGWPHGIIPVALSVVGSFLSGWVALLLMIRKRKR